MIYEVEITRTGRAIVYVEADDKSEAREAAEELVQSRDFDDLDEDVIIGEIDEQFVHNRYWSGGDQGDWVYV